MNKYKGKKIAAMAMAGVLAGSITAPVLAQAAPLTEEQVVECIMSSMAGKGDALKKALAADHISQAEWNAYITYVKDGVAAEPSARSGITSVVKKAVKFILKHLDVLPAGAVRNAFQKWGGKILGALDTITTWEWYAIASALTAAGIPDSVADLIADVIVALLPV